MTTSPVEIRSREGATRSQHGTSSRGLGFAPEIVLLLALFGLCAGAIASSDTWWHLATGRWIAEHHAVPHTDPFSFTVAGKPWIAHEYLTDLFMFALHRIGGFTLLELVNAGVLTGAFWLTYLRCRSNRWISAAVVVLAAWAARPGFAIRPQSITLAFAALTLWILTRYLEDRNWRRLLLLPALTLVWAQMHAGFALGMALILAILVVEAVDWLAHRGGAGPKVWWKLALTAVACAAVPCLNPNGFALLKFPFDVTGMKANAMISEWQPPALELPQFYPFIALIVVTLVAMMSSPKKYRPGQFLLLAVVVFAALRSARNIPIAVILLAPLAAEHLRTGAMVRGFQKSPKKLALAGASALVVAAGIFCAGAIYAGIRFQNSAEGKLFPAAAVDFIEQQHLPPNLLNDYGYGGYLIWRLYPRYKVFIDGRADLYGDAFVAEFNELNEGRIDPRPILDSYHIRTVMVQRSSQLGSLLRVMTGNGGWRMMYEDDKALIFVRSR